MLLVLLQCNNSILTAVKLLHRRNIACLHFVSVSDYFQRGGKDLAKRHTRLYLENSPPQSSTLSGNQPVVNSGTPVGRIIQTLKIPQRPLPPNAEECCMSRCETCVHDLYVMSLQRYHLDLKELRKTLAESQKEWPIDIHINDIQSDDTMYKEKFAATEAAQHAFQDMNYVEEREGWKTREMWLEAVKVVIWVLQGCRG